MSMDKLAMFMLANGSNGVNIEDIFAKETFNVSLVNSSTTSKLELIVNKSFESNGGGYCANINYIDLRANLNSSSYNATEITIGNIETKVGSNGYDMSLEGVIPIIFWGGNTKISSGVLRFNHNQISLIHNGQITESDLASQKQYIILGSGTLNIINY